MAITYVDLDAGSDANNGSTWALANLTIQTGLTAAGAGGVCYVQGLAEDTVAASRTLTSDGTILNPTKIIGVADGTIAEPPTASDLAITLPKYSNSVAGSDIEINGVTEVTCLHIVCDDRINVTGGASYWTFNKCKISWGGVFYVNDGGIKTTNTELEWLTTASSILSRINAIGNSSIQGINIYGGFSTFTAIPDNIFFDGVRSCIEIKGHDFSGMGDTLLKAISSNNTSSVKIINCSFPSVYTKIAAQHTVLGSSLEMIGCSSATAIAATESIQDYYYADIFGVIELEQTTVRTGGADDGASGLFSYSMSPYIDATLEGTYAALKSQWMSVWLSGGTSTLTVYIASDATTTDFLENEVWVEFYTPDSGDTAQHDQTFFPSDARLLDSSTIITDDTSSTWGSGGENHQKLSITVTTGFEGVGYARLHYAKRFAASPTTLYLDPSIEIT